MKTDIFVELYEDDYVKLVGKAKYFWYTYDPYYGDEDARYADWKSVGVYVTEEIASEEGYLEDLVLITKDAEYTVGSEEELVQILKDLRFPNSTKEAVMKIGQLWFFACREQSNSDVGEAVTYGIGYHYEDHWKEEEGYTIPGEELLTVLENMWREQQEQEEAESPAV